MPSYAIFSDVFAEVEHWHERVQEFPNAIEQAVAHNASIAIKESIVQIDELIYSTPETPGYHRTKNLRRSNKIKKLGPFAWLVFNDAAYAGHVHDGTSKMEGRPWMQNAVDAVQQDMDEQISALGTEALETEGAGGGAATQRLEDDVSNFATQEQ